jgi:hypothetical protein
MIIMVVVVIPLVINEILTILSCIVAVVLAVFAGIVTVLLAIFTISVTIRVTLAGLFTPSFLPRCSLSCWLPGCLAGRLTSCLPRREATACCRTAA